jgi:hypothetical protein
MRQVLDGQSTISLCMIVRNEERYISQCLTSVKSFVDQIVVVDTVQPIRRVNWRGSSAPKSSSIPGRATSARLATIPFLTLQAIGF